MFICALFAAGCSSGGGGDSFVAAPGGGVAAGTGGGANAGTGSVTFNFVKAQAPITVPTDTVQLRFEFFNGLQWTGTIVKREVRDFANTITIDNVPTSVQSTVVTAITADGFPIAEFTAAVSLPAGGDVTVSGGDGTVVPVTATAIVSSPTSIALGNSDSFQLRLQAEFSNGDTVPIDLSSGIVIFSSSDPSVATVDGNGNIIAGLNGQAFIGATLDASGFAPVNVSIPVGVGNGVQPPPTITGIQIIAPAASAITLPKGSMSVPVQVQATFSDGGTALVTTQNGVAFTSNEQASVFFDSDTQTITVANTAQTGLVARITASFQGQTDFVDVTVSGEQLVSMEVAPSAVSLPYGGFQETLVVTGTFTDDSTAPIAYTNLDFSPNAFTRFALDENTGVITTLAQMSPPAPGAETVTISHNSAPIPDVTASVEVGVVTVTQLTISPNPLTGANALVPGERQLFTLTATLSGGGTEDVSTFADIDIAAVQDASTPAVDNIAVSTSPQGAQVVAISPTGTGFAQVVFTILGADTGGADFTGTVNVEVQSEVIDFSAQDAIRYEFAGNDIADFPIAGGQNAVNLPRGYVGVVEVYAKFTSGVERRLRPSEYTLELGTVGPPDNIGGEAITLWQTDNGDSPPADYYVHPATNPEYTDEDGAPPFDTVPFDNLYYEVRTVASLPLATQEGSTVSDAFGTDDVGVAVTRETFRAVAADWRRGATARGVGTNGPVAADNSVIAPGGVRTVTVVLDPSILASDVNPNDQEFPFTVVVVDPPSVQITSAGFIGDNQSDVRTPIGTVREYEVRAQFEPPTADTSLSPDGIEIGTIGPTLQDPITNFKLAEANIQLFSNIGGAAVFAQSAPTELGFIGLYSDTQSIANNAINLRAIPIGGDNFRPVRSEIGVITPDQDSYLNVNNIYGVYSPGLFETFERAGSGRNTNPIVSTSPPVDGGIRTVNPQPGVQFLVPFLFSVDPPTLDPSDTVSINVGESQTFRTVVQWNAGEDPIDVSEDYPPVLFTDTTTPAAASRLADPAVDPGSAPFNIIVSAINAAGATVQESDVTTQSGGVILGPRVTTLNGGVMDYSPTQALVIALDAAGLPIASRGTFGAPGVPVNQPDSRGLNSPSSAVSGLTVVAAP